MDLTVGKGECFTHEYMVDYSDVTSDGRLSPRAAIDCFQNIAILHSNAGGYTLDWFHDNHCGWILLNWHIIFGKMPFDGSTFTCDTWTSPHKRSQADRDFCLTDSEGNVFARACSRWVMMDTNKRRPAKLDPDFFAAYLFDNPRPCADEDYNMKFPEDPEEINKITFPVLRHDTDTNGHANNAVYIDWALDTIPDELYTVGNLKELLVSYKKECRKGDMVCSTLFKSEDGLLCTLTNAEEPSVEFGRVIMR